MILPDVNVLVHAWRPDAARHEEYRDWLETAVRSEESFALSELVLSGFLRVVTHVNVVRKLRGIDDAFAFVALLRSRSNCVILRTGARHWPIFLELCRASGARGNLVPDAFHAALAIEHGCEWITTDRDFARFPGLRWRHPLD